MVKAIQQIKSEALEVADTIADESDHCDLSSSIPPVTKKVKILAGILKKVVQDEIYVSSRLSFLSDTERIEKETNYYFDLPTADQESDLLLIKKVTHCTGGSVRENFSHTCNVSKKILVYLWDQCALRVPVQ